MRPSALRKSKSQDTDDRRPIEAALTTEGVHREIEIDGNDYRTPHSIDEIAYAKPGFRAAIVGEKPSIKGPVTSSPLSPQPVGVTDARVIHESMSYRPPATKPILIPTAHTVSAPATPVGKGHAHDPLEDTLFLNIGTGEDYAPPPDDCPIVSESPGAVDINVYETAYREEVDKILKRKEGRRPTLYLTRRVENATGIRESDCIFDHGKSPTEIKGDLKGGIKGLVEKAKKEIELRGELQKLNEGKEGKLSRAVRNVREAKRAVEEEREIIRREDREKGRDRERSRSSTPANNRISRSGTPVLLEK